MSQHRSPGAHYAAYYPEQEARMGFLWVEGVSGNPERHGPAYKLAAHGDRP
jgi:hypothetical protein